MTTPAADLTATEQTAAPRPSFTNTPVLYPPVGEPAAPAPAPAAELPPVEAAAPTELPPVEAAAPAPVAAATTEKAAVPPSASPAGASATAGAPQEKADTAVTTERAAQPPAPSAPPAAGPATTGPLQEEEKKADVAPATEEPQSPLTRKFTEAEWAALRAFRADLPKAFADAYPDDPKGSSRVIKMWGVTIDPNAPTADARISVILMKFLRARNLNPSAAHEMLVSTLRWRELFGVDRLMNEEFDPKIFGNLAHNYGRDKQGRLISYNIFSGKQDLKTVFSDVDRFLRWRVQFMEKSILELDLTTQDQMVQIHDYEGVSMSSRDANSKRAANEASSIFGSHYPEFLAKKFFVNVPSLMSWIFWAVKPLLPAATQAKLTMVGSSHHSLAKALLPYIDESQLPMKYGGGADPSW